MIITSEFLIAIVIIISLYIIWIYHNKNRIRILVNQFPGPKALPIIGNALDFYFSRKIIADYMYGSNTKCSAFRLWFGGKPCLYLSKANDITVILSSTVHINKSSEYDFYIPWLDNNMFVSSGDQWRKMRKLFIKIFNYRILDGFVPIFNSHAHVLIKQINNEITKQSTFDIVPFTTMCAFDILCETILGVKSSTQIKKDFILLNAIENVKSGIQKRFFKMLLWPDFFFNMSAIGRKHNKSIKIAHEFTENVIKTKRQERESNIKNGLPTTNLTLIDLLLEMNENGENFSDADIRAEADGFIFGGHDTIATALGWVLFFTGSHPHVQDKIHEEVDKIFGKDKFKYLTSDDFKNLTYLECVIKESLRRMPSAPIIGRRTESDVTLDDGRIIPGGISVYINFVKLHNDPSEFPNPEKFDPDRFLPENSGNRHPCAFAPFSSGPRNCMGQKFVMMEEKVILSHIFRSYSIKAIQSLEEVKPKMELTLNAKNGIKLHFTHRD